jgi:hypothetical protein
MPKYRVKWGSIQNGQLPKDRVNAGDVVELDENDPIVTTLHEVPPKSGQMKSQVVLAGSKDDSPIAPVPVAEPMTVAEHMTGGKKK